MNLRHRCAGRRRRGRRHVVDGAGWPASCEYKSVGFDQISTLKYSQRAWTSAMSVAEPARTHQTAESSPLPHGAVVWHNRTLASRFTELERRARTRRHL